MVAFFSQKKVLYCLAALAFSVFLGGTLWLIAIQSQRDFAGANVRNAESVIRVLAKKESESKVQLNEILNPTTLRAQTDVYSSFSDVTDEQIIRVRVAKRPIVGSRTPASPRAEAIELAMVTPRFAKSSAD